MTEGFDWILVILVIALVVFAVAQQHILRLRPWWRWYRRHVGLTTLLLAIAILFLGFISATDHSAVMTAVHTFKLNLQDVPKNSCGTLGLGCAVILWTVLLIELNFVLLSDAIQAGQLRWVRNHVIICGLGDVGMQLVRQLHHKKKIVVIEKDPHNTYLDDARELGALVLVRDATDDETMTMAHPDRAVELFGMTGSDNTNAAVVALATSIACKLDPAPKTDPNADPNTPRPRHRVLRCFAHMDNPELVEATSKLSYSSQNSRVEVEFFVPQELAATEMLIGPLADRLPRDLGNRTLHFVLFGFGQQGQSLALQIGELVHLENRKRSRVTIVHDDPKQRESFLSRYPAFAPDLSQRQPAGPKGWDLPALADQWDGPYDAPIHRRSPTSRPGVSFVCNAAFVEAGSELVCDDTIAGVEYLLDREDCLPILVVCTDDESHNANLTQRLRDTIEMLEKGPVASPWGDDKIPIFVSVTQHIALHHAIIESNKQASDGPYRCELIPWAKTDQVLCYNAIAASRQRELAIDINGSYSQKYGDEARSLWSELTYWERHTNLAAAGHAPFKGRVLGHRYDLSHSADAGATEKTKSGTWTELRRTRKQLEQVAEVEHNRWIAERLLTGWRYAPLPPLPPGLVEGSKEEDAAKSARKKATTQRKERHTIVHWKDLPKMEEDKDFDQQTAIEKFFHVQIVRIDPQE
ncbi:NAD(P)-binding protein [Stieleria varia]|uniref:Potassium transporter peripheral membrane component n=1 Tax=Stieleria varia TaxID=2528005 RepID=A0A5C6AXG1_9BACT|nr:NAD(P)-binding protein [Stieleria varia]TWU04695.1 potassium transporter peripheral membrane component [Stieleria varia]